MRSYFYLRPSILICRCLIDRLRCLPATIIARKLVRPLLRRFVLEEYSACQHVIPYLLTPKSQGSHHPILTSVIRSWEEIVILPCLTLLSDEPEGLLPAALFKKFLVPVICRLFTVREYGIRLFLLKHFRCYSSLIDKSRLEKQIMPLVSWWPSRPIRISFSIFCYDAAAGLFHFLFEVEYSFPTRCTVNLRRRCACQTYSRNIWNGKISRSYVFQWGSRPSSPMTCLYLRYAMQYSYGYLTKDN